MKSHGIDNSEFYSGIRELCVRCLADRPVYSSSIPVYTANRLTSQQASSQRREIVAHRRTCVRCSDVDIGSLVRETLLFSIPQ